MRFGIVPKALKRVAGLTRVDSELKLFELRFSSCNVSRKLRFDGKVHKSLLPTFKIVKLGR